jgi:hypothetical protein
VNNELEKMWKAAVMDSFKVLSQNCLQGMKNKMTNLSQDSWCPDLDLNWAPPKRKSKASLF